MKPATAITATNEFKTPAKLRVVKETTAARSENFIDKPIAELIGRDASQTQNLNPPKFEDAKIDFHTKNLFSYFGITKMKAGKF